MSLILCVLHLVACTNGTNNDNNGGSSSGGRPPVGPPLNGQGQRLVSGSRLKVQYVLGSDGSKRLLGFWDSQRQETCDFLRVAGGGTACLPDLNDFTFSTVLSWKTNAWNWGERYADAACATPVATADTDAVPDYVFVTEKDVNLTSGPVTHIYPGQRLSAPVTTFQKSSAGVCEEYYQQERVVVLGPEIPLTDFVSGQVVTEP